ncbi:hypothetical protein ScPMuIL_010441 [Solemya velum]
MAGKVGPYRHTKPREKNKDIWKKIQHLVMYGAQDSVSYIDENREFLEKKIHIRDNDGIRPPEQGHVSIFVKYMSDGPTTDHRICRDGPCAIIYLSHVAAYLGQTWFLEYLRESDQIELLHRPCHWNSHGGLYNNIAPQCTPLVAAMIGCHTSAMEVILSTRQVDCSEMYVRELLAIMNHYFPNLETLKILLRDEEIRKCIGLAEWTSSIAVDLMKRRCGEIAYALLQVVPSKKIDMGCLVWEAKAGNYETSKLLVSRGCNVNATNHFGDRPLPEAYLYPRVLQLLLHAGANVDAQNPRSCFPSLFRAVEANAIEAVKILLNWNASKNVRLTKSMVANFYVNGTVLGYNRQKARVGDLYTSIGVAISKNYANIALLLLEDGGHLSEKETTHWTVRNKASDLYDDFLRTPCTLYKLCRLTIRRGSKGSIEDLISKLNIPNVTKNFVLFEDFS